jgi:hypothetical protein
MKAVKLAAPPTRGKQMTPEPKYLKLLHLASDATIIARNRLADAGMAVVETDPALDEAIRVLWNRQADLALAVGQLIDQELQEVQQASPETSE